MNIKPHIIVFILFITGNAWAQSDFRPGFIVTNEGDTISGKIDYRGDLLLGKMCRFTSGDESKIKEYSPFELSAFRFADSRYFVSKEIDVEEFKGKVFLEFLIQGKVDVYYYRGEKTDHYFVQKEGEGFTKLPYEEEQRMKDGKLHSYKSSTHKGILKFMMNDAPALHRRIDKLKEPAHENLISLASDYHTEITEQEDYLIFRKKLPLVSLSVEPVIAFIKYKEANNLLTEKGGHIYVWMPRKNEKLFFKTGYFFHKFTTGRNQYVVNKIPLQLQYLYPKNRLQPKVNFGFNYHFVFVDNSWISRFHTYHIGTGLHYKILERVSLTSNLSTEFKPLIFNAIDPKVTAYRKVSYNLNFGIYVRL